MNDAVYPWDQWIGQVVKVTLFREMEGGNLDSFNGTLLAVVSMGIFLDDGTKTFVPWEAITYLELVDHAEVIQEKLERVEPLTGGHHL